MSKLLLPLVLAFTFPIGAIAQAAQSPCTPPGISVGQLSAINRIGVGAPYTLTAIIKEDAVTPKGVKTSGGVTTSFQARDSQGRTRVDDPTACLLVDGDRRWMGSVSVNDPVADTFTSWQVEAFRPRNFAGVKKGAFKVADPPSAQQEFDGLKIVSQASDHDPHAESNVRYEVEDLGKRTIAGLQASGMRITKTLPAGSLINTPAAGLLPDNTRPYTEVEDRWISNQYRLIVMDILNSEATGMSSYEVTNFTLGEPDPSLFQPPAGYSINNLAAK